MVLTEDVKALFKTVRTMLGAPIRIVQLEDEQLCDLLDVAIGDYAEKVQNWVIETQWLNIQNKSTIQFQNASELAYAMTIRTMDWSRDYSYWFSREVGLQQRGNYELKKDFFQDEKGKQVYVPKLIYPDVEIVDGDIKIIDETLFSEYSKDVIRDIKKTMKDFWLGTV